MRHDGWHSALTLAACFTVTILGLLAAPALAGERGAWTYSIAAATSKIYDYRIDEFSFGSYPESFDPGLSVGGAAVRRLTRHVSLVLEGGYRGYSKALALESIPEALPTTTELRAEFFSLGAGLRLERWSDPAVPLRPYVQIIPALFVSRWEERTVDHEGYDFYSGAWRPRTTHSDSFRSVLPGFAVSTGVRARITSVVGTDVAVRLTRSADLGEHALGRSSSGDFLGLDEVALVGSLAWSP